MRSYAEKVQNTIAKRFKEGRGSGTGKDYKPFITVRDFPSLGRVHRIPSIKVGRVHHLLSDLERDIFYRLNWYYSIRDIREQFPIPLEFTEDICERLRIAHPEICGVGHIVTTDFLVDIHDSGKVITKALSAKYAADLDDPRTLEKLEIERRYWKENGIQFHIVTEESIPKLLKQNIEWVYPYLKSFEFSGAEQQEYFELLCAAFEKNSSLKVTAIASGLDENFNMESGHHLSVLRHLLAQQAFSFDMENTTIKNLLGSNMLLSKHWLNRSYEYVACE